MDQYSNLFVDKSPWKTVDKLVVVVLTVAITGLCIRRL